MIMICKWIDLISLNAINFAYKQFLTRGILIYKSFYFSQLYYNLNKIHPRVISVSLQCQGWFFIPSYFLFNQHIAINTLRLATLP